MPFTTRLLTVPYVCRSCTLRLSAQSYLSSGLRCHITGKNVPRTSLRRHAYSTITPKRPFRIAVIGSGPAGFYTAYRLMKRIDNAVVDMYEQLPVPYGLVRFGVAPDHPEVKNCEEKFEQVAESPRFNYIGNVKVGYDVDLIAMKPHYDAILFSYGASQDRKLAIPGEDLPGVFSAREFVGWYNGLPQFQDLKPDLQAGDTAVIIGQGNVALDVARILVTPVEKLRGTDITEQAIQALDRSRIKNMKVVGRRGPLQAAFTVKEVRELMNIDGVAFEPIDSTLYPSDLKSLPRVQKRVGEVLLKGSTTPITDSIKAWGLNFLQAPKSMNASTTTNHLSSVTFTHQQFAPDTDKFSKSAQVVPTDEESTIETSLAFRSVGYKSAALPGLSDLGVQFDPKLGIIPNDPYGRVISSSRGPGSLGAGHVPGIYCAGWVKRGPTGVIASTMEDAFASADVIAEDWESGVTFLNSETGEHKGTGMGWDGIKDQVIAKGVRPLSWSDWKVIDEAERRRGESVGKKREKFGSVKDMLKVLDA